MVSEAATDSKSLRVLILAGRLGIDDDGWPLMPLVERLESRGASVQVLCVDYKHEPENFGQIIEKPMLKHRWLRWFCQRQLAGDDHLHQPDLIHVVHDEMANVALPLAERWQIPYMISIDGYGIIDRGLRLSRRWCRSLIASSPELAQTLQKELGVPADLLSVIRPGIVMPETPARVFGSGRIPVIGTAGRSMEVSGFHIFFEAAREVLAKDHDAEFMVALQGDDELDIRRLAQRMGIGDRVTVADFSLLGPRYWKVLDLYCQPSIAPSAGRTLTLALAHEVPCIASRVPGLRELIQDGETGLIVPRAEPFPLAHAILKLLDEKAAARELARSAAASIRLRFDPEAEADHLVTLYRTLVSSQA